ncbi:MAG: hypothetical protein PHX83_07170 [Acidobacteriia bacterium]|nr:hypothetical protein [Terriglobia bacterium]
MEALRSFVDFLNSHSGAISALSTAIYALSTIALIFLTVNYVRLTRSLAASSNQQVSHIIKEQEDRLEANKQGLHELTKIFLIILNKLPGASENIREMIGVTLWTEEDLVDMRHLARGLGGFAIGNVFWAIYHLNGIRHRVTEVQHAANGREQALQEFPWEDYAASLTQAKQELTNLLGIL